MPKFQLINSLKPAPSGNHCNEIGIISQNKMQTNINTDYFDATLLCNSICKDGTQEASVIEKRFEPHKNRLASGDGRQDKIAWSYLGMTLDTWGADKCLHESISKCNGVEKVDKTSMVQMSSGDWKYNGKIDCKRKDIVYSPFAERFKLKNKGIPKITKEDTYRTPNQQSSLYEFLNTDEEAVSISSDDVKSDNIKNCKNIITVTTCFGDCILGVGSEANGEVIETLATTDPLGDGVSYICADKLLAKIAGKNLSKSVKKVKCEKFAWEVMHRAELSGKSCAAVRGEFNCSSIVAKSR